MENKYNYRVFISYSNEDLTFVNFIVNELEKYDITVWRDKDVLYKHAGERFEENIRKGIRESEVILYIHSPHSMQSDFVQDTEIPYALSLKKKIFIYKYETEDKKFERNPALKEIQAIKLLINPDSEEQDPLFSMRIALQRHFKMLSPSGEYICLETNSASFPPGTLTTTLLDEFFIIPIPLEYRAILEEYNFYTKPCDNNRCEKYLERVEILIKKKCPEIIRWDEYINKVYLETAKDFFTKKQQGKTIFNGPMIGVSSVIADRSSDGKEIHSLHFEFYRSDYFTFKVMSRLYKVLKADFGYKLFDIKSLQDIKAYNPFFSSLGMGGFLLMNDDNELKTLWIKRSQECEAGNLYHFSYDETVSMKDWNEETGAIDLYQSLYRGLKEELGILYSDLTPQGGIFEIGLILTATRIELELLSYVMLNPSKNIILWDKMRAAEDSKLEIGKAYLWSSGKYKAELADKILTPEALSLIKRLEVRKSDNTLLAYQIYSPNSRVDAMAVIGHNTSIDDYTIVSGGADIGESCRIHRYIFIDNGVVIGNNVKIQDHVMIPHGVTLEDGVFVGPSVVFTNDKYPRSVTPDGRIKNGDDWTMTPTVIKEGASLGAGAVIVCGVTVGRWAMIGAGAVVTHDVPDYALVVGCPAKIIGYVDEKGEILS